MCVSVEREGLLPYLACDVARWEGLIQAAGASHALAGVGHAQRGLGLDGGGASHALAGVGHARGAWMVPARPWSSWWPVMPWLV
jgi:hypothetical protein